jgi:hypothetical protein
MRRLTAPTALTALTALTSSATETSLRLADAK